MGKKMAVSPKTKVLITIDTEEDEWGEYTKQKYNVENISRLPLVQELFDRYNARPTYLVDWPVATNSKAVDILKSILNKNQCAIGTHCHSWNTPPQNAPVNEFTSMLSNLPYQDIYCKIGTLHQAITDAFGKRPTVFRSGRYGFNSDVARSLIELGYVADSSMTPFRDWRKYSGPDFRHISTYHFRFHKDSLSKASKNGPLIEFPLSIGFLQSVNSLHKIIRWTFSVPPFSKIKIIGLLEKLSIHNLAWLSPEKSDGPTMIRLANRFVKLKHSFLVLDFHSTSLLPGKSPYVRNSNDLKKFLRNIEHFLMYTQINGYECITLENAAESIIQDEMSNA